jgi:hypothetical protein
LDITISTCKMVALYRLIQKVLGISIDVPDQTNNNSNC